MSEVEAAAISTVGGRTVVSVIVTAETELGPTMVPLPGVGTRVTVNDSVSSIKRSVFTGIVTLLATSPAANTTV